MLQTGILVTCAKCGMLIHEDDALMKDDPKTSAIEYFHNGGCPETTKTSIVSIVKATPLYNLQLTEEDCNIVFKIIENYKSKINETTK